MSKNEPGPTPEDFLPRMSTPARPRPRTIRKPIKRVALSSLPPSSPPLPTSSRERLHEDLAGSPPIPAAVRDDPFGFFAAEQRIKERKLSEIGEEKGRKVLQPRAPHDENRPESVLAAMGIRVNKQSHKGDDEKEAEGSLGDERPAFATPPRPSPDSTLEFDLSSFNTGFKTPTGHTPDPRAATPRQRRRKKRRFPLNPSSRSLSPDPDVDAVSQSPSPTKRVRDIRRPLADIPSQDNSPKKPASKRSKAGKPARKVAKTDETLAEEHLGERTKSLRELLPRRPTRRVAQRKSSAAVKVPDKRRKNAPSAKRLSKKGKEAAVGEKEGESFVLNGEEREVCILAYENSTAINF